MVTEIGEPDRGGALISAAKRGWEAAVGDFFHPPLPDPVIEHSPEAASFFYIDSSTWTVHLNTAGVPLHLTAEESESFLRSVCQHEIQHYLLCPYDGVMSGMMFAAARRQVSDELAMFVTNLFADLVVESSLLERYPVLTHERITASIHESSMRSSQHSGLWGLIVACHRAMWGFPIPPSAEVGDELYATSQEISRIARKSIHLEKRWPQACEKIAKLISQWLPEDEQSLGDASLDVKFVTSGALGIEGEGSYLPVDVDAIMGSPLEDRNGDVAKRCMGEGTLEIREKDLERLAGDVNARGGDLEDLEAVLLLAGIGSPQAEWIRFWYRAEARDSVRFEIKVTESAGSVPLTPEVWRLGDPVEELDIVQSLQSFPVLVPNMSTRRWKKILPDGPTTDVSLPDLLIVIDSSGSMTWRMSSKRVAGPYHTALVAAFAALSFAVQNNRRMAAINFSDGTKTSDWSNERSDVERILLTYQGGGTVAPVKAIEEACSSSEAKVLALIITDAEVSNWNRLVQTIAFLTRQGHKLVLFHIGGGNSTRDKKTHESLAAAGACVHSIRSTKDLPGLVVREVRSAYRI
jgi:hypothetical protein